ncbi:Possible neuromedin U precursor [hydrothermal vent metagenome]|uniref:Possible neuromedin U n=1 Tax=hydrothermal vent metagenome TaxID=652676 RepID=A0A1W1C671_9ZZZZ
MDDSSDFGDLILPVGVGKVNKLGWSWGAGATFIFPTSNNDLLGSHQYQAGPTALLLWANKDWTIGTHIQHWWGFADDGKSNNNPIIKAAHEKNLNHTDMQYFIVRNLPNAWQLRASPHITYDWSAKKDNRLTLPVAFGIGKMIKIGPMPVMLMAEYQKTLISPDNIGNDSTIMLQANFIIKNPFGDL